MNFWGCIRISFCQFFRDQVSNSTRIAIFKICQDLIYGVFSGEAGLLQWKCFSPVFQQKTIPPLRAFLRMVGRQKIWFAERMKSAILAPRIRRDTHTESEDKDASNIYYRTSPECTDQVLSQQFLQVESVPILTQKERQTLHTHGSMSHFVLDVSLNHLSECFT